MALVQDILDRFQQLRTDRAIWDKHYVDIATYTLPDAERFDSMFTSGSVGSAIDSVVAEPIASKRGREIYDQTSLWAVDRGAAGEMALVTPQTSIWHDITKDDPFGGELNEEEKLWCESTRDYLFATRGNPRSGFWMAHRAALRCKWAFGTAVMYIGAANRGVAAPISYAFVPISENYLGTNFEGVVDTNYRFFTRSARQCVERWGNACSAKTKEMAADPKRRDRLVSIVHAVYPRSDESRYGKIGVYGMGWASCTVEYAEKHLISESGYEEFPYRVDHWQRNSNGPYAEGPIALALAEIKSLNLLAKTALRGAQQSVDPPMAHAIGFEGRLNLNPRAVNPGLVSNQGQLLAQPLVTVRADFAQTILDTKRDQVATTTYIKLWTAILDSDRQQTAYEVAIKNAERADQIGPIGTSSQVSLSFQVEREIGILSRMGAFAPGSPLAAPRSMQGQSVGARFTSPLDRARKLGELQGMQQLWALAAQISERKPEVLDKLDADASIDFAQEVLGSPQKIMTGERQLAAIREARAAQQNQQATIQNTAAAGVAAQQSAAGAEALAASPAAQEILKQLGGVAA